MRILFICTLALIALFAGAFYYVFYTPALVIRAVPAVAEKYLKGATLTSFSIGGQSFEYPEVLKLFKVTAEVEWKNESYQFTAHEIDILNFQTFWRVQQQAIISVRGMTFQKKNFSLTDGGLDATLNFEGDRLVGFGGVLRNGQVNLNPYQLSGTQVKFEGNQDGFKISDIVGQAYGGQVKGQIKIEFKPHHAELVLIEFNNLRSQELVTLNKPIFSQIEGVFDGTLRLTRVDQQIQVLAILAEMRKGGTMEKGLCKRILSYMTDEENRYAVEALIESKDRLHFDNSEFRILNVSQNLAGVTVTMVGKKDNFRIHETINIDISRVLQKIAWKN